MKVGTGLPKFLCSLCCLLFKTLPVGGWKIWFTEFMPRFWHKSETRGRETVAFWRRFLPLMKVGGTSPDQHEADCARLAPLAQVQEDGRAAAKSAKQAELARCRQIRSLNLAVPQLIAGQFDNGHAVRSALAAVYPVVPRSAELNLHRARILLPVWKAADAALAARSPGAAIVRDGVGITDFEKLVLDWPAAVQSTADAVVAFRSARTALRAQHRRVDRMNKRAYGKFKAEGRSNPSLGEALRTAITREKTGQPRRRKKT
jgi:hypothetical protein